MTPAERLLHARLTDPLCADVHPVDPSAPACNASWVRRLSEYAAFHRDAVARIQRGDKGGPTPKIVVYSCMEQADDATSVVSTPDCGGFADRLAGMSHVFLLALLHNWLFFASWPGQGEVFNSPLFDYTWKPELGAGRVSESFDFLSCPFQGKYKDCPLGLPDVAAVLKADVNYISTNRGGLRWGAPDRVAKFFEWGLDKWTQGGCVFRALLLPTPAVVERLKPFALQLLSPNHRVIGVHRRTGDKQMHNVETSVPFAVDGDIYWQCAMLQENYVREISNGTDRAVYFLVTDSAAYKREALAHWGPAKLLVTDVDPIHIARQQLMWDVSALGGRRLCRCVPTHPQHTTPMLVSAPALC